jgi:acid phosphatase (class A)
VYATLLSPAEFPAEPESPTDGKYLAAQALANKVQFRRYWDPELRASVYLTEFLKDNSELLLPSPGQESGALVALLDKEGYHEALHREKGAQLREVLEMADERQARFTEIIDQHSGEGAIKYWLGMLSIDAGSAPATYQLIRVARRVGEIVVMCLKDHYREARPSQVCPAIVPMIDPPVTPAFPAGHALQSHLISLCLAEARRTRNQSEMLFGLSRRVAENRVIAGLHYPLDNEAGVFAAKECFKRLTYGTEFKKLVTDARAESARELRS